MSIYPQPLQEKLCLVYCGDDRCTCSAREKRANFFDLFDMRGVIDEIPVEEWTVREIKIGIREWNRLLEILHDPNDYRVEKFHGLNKQFTVTISLSPRAVERLLQWLLDNEH